MKRVVLIFAVLFLIFPALPAPVCAQSDSMVHVKAFPGVTVGQKVTNAMATCPVAPVPCILVIDASLATAATGTMPTLCATCSLQDYRSGAISPNLPGVSSDGLNGVRVTGGVAAATMNQTDRTTTGNLALKNQSLDEVCYAGYSTGGGVCSDSNDGLSWGTCKATIYACYKQIFAYNQVDGGLIYVANGATAGGPDGSLRIMGLGDPNWSIMTASLSGSTLSVTAISGGALSVGSLVYGNGIPLSSITALGTGTGGTGTYTISSSGTASSGSMSATPPIWLPQMPVKILGTYGHLLSSNTSSATVIFGTGSNPQLWISGTDNHIEIDNIVDETGCWPMAIAVGSGLNLSSGLSSSDVNLQNSYAYGVTLKDDSFRSPQGGCNAGTSIIGSNATNVQLSGDTFSGPTGSGRATNGSDSSEALVINPYVSGGYHTGYAGNMLLFGPQNDEMDNGDLKYYDGFDCTVAGPSNIEVDSLTQLNNFDGKGAFWAPVQYCAIITLWNIQAGNLESGVSSAPAVEIDSASLPNNINGWGLIKGSPYSSTASNNWSGAGVNHVPVDGSGTGAVCPPILPQYLVSTLPTCNSSLQSDFCASVIDATAPTFLGALTGGGSVHTPVFCNGNTWVSY